VPCFLRLRKPFLGRTPFGILESFPGSERRRAVLRIGRVEGGHDNRSHVDRIFLIPNIVVVRDLAHDQDARALMGTGFPMQHNDPEEGREIVQSLDDLRDQSWERLNHPGQTVRLSILRGIFICSERVDSVLQGRLL
jgi:hypothetical protein